MEFVSNLQLGEYVWGVPKMGEPENHGFQYWKGLSIVDWR